MDAHLVGQLAVLGAQLCANDGTAILRVVGSGGAAGADGPDRFIGNRHVDNVACAHVGQPLARLALQHGFGLAGFVFGQRLADAHDWLQPTGEHGPHFLIHQLIALAEDLAAFGVADDDVVHDAREHVDGDFTGERALRFEVGVLRAEFDRAPL